jgi:hypothetical protein
VAPTRRRGRDAVGLANHAVLHNDRLPFVFEASGSETQFTNGFDPSPRARKLFNFPKPETRARIMRDVESNRIWLLGPGVPRSRRCQPSLTSLMFTVHDRIVVMIDRDPSA